MLEQLQIIDGAGSIHKKMGLICNAVEEMRHEEEVKMFLRILVKNMRIGMKEKSMAFWDHEKSDRVTDVGDR